MLLHAGRAPPPLAVGLQTPHHHHRRCHCGHYLLIHRSAVVHPRKQVENLLLSQHSVRHCPFLNGWRGLLWQLRMPCQYFKFQPALFLCEEHLSKWEERRRGVLARTRERVGTGTPKRRKKEGVFDGINEKGLPVPTQKTSWEIYLFLLKMPASAELRAPKFFLLTLHTTTSSPHHPINSSHLSPSTSITPTIPMALHVLITLLELIISLWG